MRVRSLFVISAILVLFAGCGTQKKLSTLKGNHMSLDLSFLEDSEAPVLDSTGSSTVRDTLRVTGLDGEQLLIMKAIKDDDGNMVAHDVLDAAKVTARFRNVAERAGKVSINFQVIVPQEMMDSKWQLRLFPDMYVMEDSIRLDPIYITGQDYRRTQLRGYERYNRFVDSIIQDSTAFVNASLLDRFLRRNFREVYAFRNDTTIVTDNEWRSAFGVTGSEAVAHYTYGLRVKMNERKKSRMDRMYRRYVKSPILSEGLRLDTIMRANDGSFIYDYVQEVNTRPKLRSIDIMLSGEIFEQDEMVYSVPQAGPLTFYISTLGSLKDARTRYLTKIVERRASADTRFHVEFATAKHDIDMNLSNNREETDRMREILRSLMRNETFDLDSVVVVSYASPEGRQSYNASLSLRRARSLGAYLNSEMTSYADSLNAEAGFSVDSEGNVTANRAAAAIEFVSRSHGEDWETLDAMVSSDSLLTFAQKEEYRSLMDLEPDRRETTMQKYPWYRRLRENMYPELRSVRVSFYLHRKGMVKDTVQTTTVDSVYMKGVKALDDLDYEGALEYLRPYEDYNTAVAHLGVGHEASAFEILSAMKRDARVNYLLALIYSRRGEDQNAVECYIRSCEQDPSFVHRGNLDPEISVLIERYGLNRDDEDEFEYSF